jgi:chitin disaccharide deacetylase
VSTAPSRNCTGRRADQRHADGKRAAATDDAIEIARATPSLGVGCHVVLVDGEPVLSAGRDIPHLARRIHRPISFLALQLSALVTARDPDSLHLRSNAAEIEAEAAAQIASATEPRSTPHAH